MAAVTLERAPRGSVAATLAAAALLALAGTAGVTFAVLALALGGFVIAFGLPPVMGSTSVRRSSLVLALATTLAGAAVLVVDTDPPLRLLPVAVAVSVIAMFLAQLTRADNRPRLISCLAGDAFGIAVITSGMTLAPLVQSRGDDYPVAASMAAVGLSCLLDPLLTRSRRGWLFPAAALLGAVGAVVVGSLVASSAALGSFALLGAVSAGVAHAVRRILVEQSGGGERGGLTVAAAGALTPGLAVFTIARLMLG